ncbi:hypothetical protein DPX16_9395 [Anabarilius grahami]|uniref:Uncharacterized protein n=1 Tax=Anabarilius grahami TaxID=495550 RepID=A0A3N0Y6R8_ANAGA|nr:hypothetical protein DPX16_9395 [Anabarilius grahami]
MNIHTFICPAPPLHQNQTQGNDPNTDDDDDEEELLCLHSQPPLASCETVRTLTLQTLSWPVIGREPQLHKASKEGMRGLILPPQKPPDREDKRGLSSPGKQM